MRLIRILFVVYLVVLTVLLLLPDPTVVTAGHPLPRFLRDHFTHFLLFSGLTLLTLSSRWPLRFGVVLAILVVYAIAMEGLQAFSPPRDVSLADMLENLLGVAVGTAIWWPLARRHARRRR